jgi:hypothetical protein
MQPNLLKGPSIVKSKDLTLTFMTLTFMTPSYQKMKLLSRTPRHMGRACMAGHGARSFNFALSSID